MTNQFFVRVISLFFFILCGTTTYAQSLSETEKKFQEFAINNLQEKVYAHLNRTDHIAGEILWFKIYYVDGRLHRPLDLSKIVYVEILDLNNRPVLKAKVSIKKGEGAGSFYIPATLTTGNYLFRAYTKWMKNNSVEYFFHQKISIANTLKAVEPEEVRIVTNTIDAQFFPEGGYLIENIACRVGFKVTDQAGNGVDCSGELVNHVSDTVIKFMTTKFGIGSFSFTPQANNQYRAIITNHLGKSRTFTLPEIKKSGFGLMAKDSSDEILTVRVSNTEKLFSAQLFIHTRQSIKVSEVKSSSDGSIDFWVSKNKLGDGISHITILDEKNQPVCERLYFKKPRHTMDISVTPDQREYSVRRKVQVKVGTDEGQNANLSVSVFRTDSISLNENILTNFFLTSDLPGTIGSPEYYFSNSSDTQTAADNLMLTHGWRRFRWEEILSSQKTVITHLPELKGQLVQGKIKDLNGKVVSDKMAYLTSPGKKIRLYVSKSDTAGKVHFQMRDFEQAQKVIAQTNFNVDSLFHIEIDNPFSDQYADWRSAPLILKKSTAAGLLDRSISMQVQDAFYEDEVYFRFKSPESDTIPFYGNADEVYWLDDYTRFPVLEEVLREYVKGVWVRKRGNQFRFMVLDKGKIEKTEVFRENPLTLIDGVPVFDVNRILAVDPLNIKKLEVMTRKYFLGPLVFNGIVSFSTYNGDLSGYELDPRSVALDYEGLQSQREFFNPRYTSPELRNSRLPDQRYQLYWNSNVNITLENPTTLEFYTSDVEGQFYVVIEGLSKAGMPGSAVSTFKVSR